MYENEPYLIPFWQMDPNNYGKPVEKLWVVVQKLVWTLHMEQKTQRDLCHYQRSDTDRRTCSFG